MPGFFEAAAEVFAKTPKQKKHTVTIEGKEVEVSLEKCLEIKRTLGGEESYMFKDGQIVRRPIKKIKSEAPVLKKSKSGVHFHESDPFWVERIAEEGYTWQIQSE